MLMLPLGVLAQNSIKGKVVNGSNGQPLAGVTVSVKVLQQQHNQTILVRLC